VPACWCCLRTWALTLVLSSASKAHAAALQFDSHEKSLARGKTEIQLLVSQLNIRPRDDMTEAAHRLYRLALQRNFTRGRRTNQVTSGTARLHARVVTTTLHAVARSAGISTHSCGVHRAGGCGMPVHCVPAGREALHAHRLLRRAAGACSGNCLDV
jgi:hypothetical protein